MRISTHKFTLMQTALQIKMQYIFHSAQVHQLKNRILLQTQIWSKTEVGPSDSAMVSVSDLSKRLDQEVK